MFKETNISSLSFNPFDKIGKEWCLISATSQGKTNTMTASWGALGHLWNKDIAIIFIRPQRYTKEFIDASDTFSISFFEGHHTELSYLGTKSGRDENKIENVHFDVIDLKGTPTFKQAKEVFFCRKLYVDSLKKDSFLFKEIYDKNYPNDDLHIVYIGEIEKVYINE